MGLKKIWRANARMKSRRFLKDKCEICGGKKDLTIHHVVPLKFAIVVNRHNCMTLCKSCHFAIERYPSMAHGRVSGLFNDRGRLLDDFEYKLDWLNEKVSK